MSLLCWAWLRATEPKRERERAPSFSRVGCSRLRVAMVVSRVGMVVILMGVGVMGLCGACFDFSDRSFFPVTLLSS